MAAIDIGDVNVVSRSYGLSAGYLHILKTNPANLSGKITQVQLYAKTGYSMANVRVGTCYIVSGTNYSSRDYEDIGTVAAGAVRTFTVDLDVEAGDVLCCTFTSGQLCYVEPGGAGIRYIFGGSIPFTNEETSNASTTGDLSFGGTGATIEVSGTNAIFFGMNF